MKKMLFVPILIASSINFGYTQNFSYGSSLTGDTKLSCEAILCLASPTKPGACMPSLNRYFGFSAKKWRDVVTKRKNFLNLCPTSSAENDQLLASIGIDADEQNKNIGDFKNSVLEIPHDCSANSLNNTQEQRKESFSIYSAYVDRYAVKHNLTAKEKRRMLNKYDHDDDYNYDALSDQRSNVYRVSSNIPAACERFYNHAWSPERPKHSGDYNWYYKSEKIPAVWQ